VSEIFDTEMENEMTQQTTADAGTSIAVIVQSNPSIVLLDVKSKED
jgi:hypothetical protein